MEKVKLGVYVSEEVNEELSALVTQVKNTVRIFNDYNIEFPLLGRNKGEIVEEILLEGIKRNRNEILDLLKTNFDNDFTDKGDFDMNNSIELPDTQVYVKSMRDLLNNNPNKEFEPKEVYSIMAERLKLSEKQIDASMPRDGRNWHENRCQWARNKLKEEGIIDSLAPRGIWRLA